MKVYGALEAAQIEWFTNAGKPAASSYPFRVIYVTDLKQIQVSDGTNWNPSALYTYTAGTLPAAGASNQYQVAFITDTLQVKVSNGTEWKTIGARLDTYTSGTIPAAASNTNSIIWVSDLQQVQVSNGSAWVQVGSKAGTKNYFSQNNANADFETNSVSPWSACTLTFSSGVPSGAPTLTATQMAIATTATTPLSGTYSMLLSKSAANAQYQGFISGALTIDREDTAKVLYGSFYYEVVSGTIDLSGSSTQSLEIWIYNTVSGQWTQPAGYRGMNQSSGVGKVVFSFQTDGTYANNAYKIAVITQQTGTSAFVVEFDDFQVGPQAIVLGSAMTDKISFSPALTNAGNATATGTYQRIGSNALIEVIVTIGSSLPTGTIKVGKPNNLTFDYSGQQFWNATVPVTWASGDKIYISATVPIAGWGSFSQMSSDTDTRVVNFRATRATSQSIPNISASVIQFNSIKSDSHNSWESASNWYRVPVSGTYEIYGSIIIGMSANTGEVRADLFVDGVQVGLQQNFKSGTAGGNLGLTYSYQRNLNAGQTIQIKCYQGNTGGGALNIFGDDLGYGDVTSLYINRLSGPSVITATETVAASYFMSSNQSVTANVTLINYDSKVFDTHNAVTTGASWKFLTPVSGKYQINTLQNALAGTSSIALYKNGSIFMYTSTSGSSTLGFGSALINLNAGDEITFRCNQSVTLYGAAYINGPNQIQIYRVGN